MEKPEVPDKAKEILQQAAKQQHALKRSPGEAEVRTHQIHGALTALTAAAHSGKSSAWSSLLIPKAVERTNPVTNSDRIKQSQLEQLTHPRGYVSDVDSNVFDDIKASVYLDAYAKAAKSLDSELSIATLFGEGKIEITDYNSVPAFDQKGMGAIGLNNSEYFNRKMRLLENGTGPLDRQIYNRLESLKLMGANADIDADALSGADIVDPPMPPLVGFPIPEMVNLPRFIMRDLEPFMFQNEPQFLPEAIRLPYPKFLFELGPDDDKHLVVVSQQSFHAVTIEYLHTDHEIPFEIGAMGGFFLHKDAETLDIQLQPWQTDSETANRMMMAIIGFVAEFNIGNTIIGTEPRDPNRPVPEAGKTRVHRIVRVVTGVKKVRTPWQGGTHASPREHVRCAHWRRIKGERRWFPATIVNKGVIGKVSKVYHVSKKDDEPKDL